MLCMCVCLSFHVAVEEFQVSYFDKIVHLSLPFSFSMLFGSQNC